MPSELTEPRLKQVSVLFTDVVGSTELGGRLDPEDIHDIMDMALRRFAAIVASHGGRVLKYTGDGLLAAFGADAAQEDDAERAVRAGLAFLDEARRIAVEVRRDYARDGVEGFDIRVGVDTGPVLVGGGLEAEANIRGTVVNMAARMEQSAPTAALRISHATHQQIRGLFDVLEQAPIRVKGSAAPLVTYLVERVRPHAFRKANRGIQGLATALVGRDVELARLEDALSAAMNQRRCVGVTVVAEAGVGKSRLLYEFEDRALTASPHLHSFRSRAQPQSVHRPYGLLREVITSGLDLPEGAGVETAARSFEQRVVTLFEAGDGADAAQAHAHLLGQLIGFDFSGSHHLHGILEDPRQIRNRAFNAAAQVIRRVQDRDGAPVVLLLDDLHWADEGSLDFIDHLVRVNHDVPILILGLTRPEFFDRRSKWGSRMKSHVRLDLPTLEAQSRSELADALLQKFDPIPGRLRTLLVERSEGNPFYMEELLKMLIDAGSIVVDGDRWRLVAEALNATAVPATLTGVIQARLDRLAPELRATLQQASVIGPVFWDRAIAALDAHAVESLGPLAQRAFVVAAERSAFEGMREFAFAHHILHQVTYDSVLKKTRREYHVRAAAWLASVAEQGAGDHSGAVAEHFERAGDLANAVIHYTRAAERAAARYAHQAVSAYATRGLAHIAPQDDETRWLLLLLRQRALRFQGAMLAQGQDLDALQAIADTANDDSKRATVLLRRAVAFKETGDSRAAVTMARQSQVLAQALGLARVELSCLSTLSGALRSLGEHSEARRAAQEALALAHRIGDRAVEAECLTNLAAVANEQGDYAASAKLLRQSLPIERAMENRQGECAALINLGDSEYRLGDYANARRDLEEALRLARSIGTRGLESVALLNLSSVAHFQLDNDHALEYARAAVAIAEDIANREYEAFAQIGLGHAHLGLRSFGQARDVFARARDLLLSLEMPHLAVEAVAGLAQVALEQGANDESLAHANNVLARIDRVGNLDGTEHPLLIRLICYRALMASGDPRAASVLARARAELWAKAEAISDPQSRRKLLQDVPYNREIEALGSKLDDA